MEATSHGAPDAGTPSLRITEVFYSLQGEGLDTGLPTVFVRLTGCSLRCSWCDTAYSFHGGGDRPLEDLLTQVEAFPVKRACVTGGEPLDQMDGCLALMDALLARGWDVVLETSGGVAIDKAVALPNRERLRVSLDVKCPSSSMQNRNVWSNLGHLLPHDQVKFVIATADDYAFVKGVLAKHDIPAEIVLNPMWEPPADAPGLKMIEKRREDQVDMRWVAERVLEDGLDVRVGTQLHKVIWGAERGR